MADNKPIIIVKKKGHAHAHHGGAWKIAYADFVTAMMAFFLVMWLLSTAESPTRKAIASYFRRPGIFQTGSGTPIESGSGGLLDDGLPPTESSENEEIDDPMVKSKKKHDKNTGSQEEKTKYVANNLEDLKEILKKTEHIDDAAAKMMVQKLEQVADQKQAMQQIADTIKKEILSSPELNSILGKVDVKVDGDGLTIEIMDTEKTSMFTLGSSVILAEAQQAISKIADILNTVSNPIDIVGHTDSTPFKSKTGGYTNWELSTDRANSARKILVADGIDDERITSVVGKAATDPKKKDDPSDASNRRITIKMRFVVDESAPILEGDAGAQKLEEVAQKAVVTFAGNPNDDIAVPTSSIGKQSSTTTKGNTSKFPNPKTKDKIFKGKPNIGPAQFYDR